MGPPESKALFLGADFNDPTAIDNENFDPQIFEDQKEEDLLNKVEAFKRHFLEMKEKAEAAEQELALSEIKIEEIIKKT